MILFIASVSVIAQSIKCAKENRDEGRVNKRRKKHQINLNEEHCVCIQPTIQSTEK
jgi:hypothetical protein